MIIGQFKTGENQAKCKALEFEMGDEEEVGEVQQKLDEEVIRRSWKRLLKRSKLSQQPMLY